MLLRRLSEARGVSGHEDEVREIVRKEIQDVADETHTDYMGNLYVRQKGKGPHICLMAHMDEVGLIITGKGKGGLYNFDVVGGMNDEVLPSCHVEIGPHRTCGVVGLGPIHLQDKEANDVPIKRDKLRIDVGDEKANSVEIGHIASFATRYGESGGRAFGKAFDDRIGCCCMIEALRTRLDANLTCVFTVQEEIGVRGSLVASSNVECDAVIACEGTFSLDMPGTPKEERMPVMGKGPALTLADALTISDKSLLHKIESAAEHESIDYQYKRPMAGGTDVGAFGLKGRGVASCVIATPCRYIHSPCSMADLRDIDSTRRLVIAAVDEIKEG